MRFISIQLLLQYQSDIDVRVIERRDEFSSEENETDVEFAVAEGDGVTVVSSDFNAEAFPKRFVHGDVHFLDIELRFEYPVMFDVVARDIVDQFAHREEVDVLAVLAHSVDVHQLRDADCDFEFALRKGKDVAFVLIVIL